MKWIYETGKEEPEILGSGSNYSLQFASTDFNKVLEAFSKGSRNYLIRSRYEQGRIVREEYDPVTKVFMAL